MKATRQVFIYCWLIVLLVCHHCVWGQDGVDIVVNEAIKQYNNAEYTQAVESFSSILASKQGVSSYTKAKCLTWRGESWYYLGEQKKSFDDYLAAADIIDCQFTGNKDTVSFYPMILQSLGYWYCYYNKGEDRLKTYESFYNYAANLKSDSLLIESQYLLALVYNDAGDWDRALTYGRGAYDLAVKRSDTIQTIWCMGALAETYQAKGDFDTALGWISHGLNLFRGVKWSRSDTTLVASIYGQLATICDEKQQRDSVHYYLDKAIELRQNLYKKDLHPELLIVQYKKIRVLLGEERWDEASNILDKIIAAYKVEKGKQPIRAYYYRGIVHLRKQEYIKGEEVVNAALKATDENDAYYEKIVLLYADILANINENNAALKRLEDISERNKNGKVTYLPGSRSKASITDVLSNIERRAEVLMTIAHNLQDKTYAQYCLNTVLYADSLIMELRKGYYDNSSRRWISKNAKKIYTLGVEATHFLLKEETSPILYNYAFEFIEKNKSLLLAEYLSSTQNHPSILIPNDSIKKERRLLWGMEQSRVNKNNKAKDSIGEFEKTKEQLDHLLAWMQETDPAYFELKYRTPLASLEETKQELLGDDEWMVQYLLGDDYLYTFLFNKKGEKYLLQKKISKAAHQKVLDFQYDIYYQKQDWHLNARELYSILLENVIDIAGPNSALVIVPEGILGYTAFGILLKEDVTKTQIGQYKDYPYVLMDHQLRYCFSASVMLQADKYKKKGNGKVLALSPSGYKYKSHLFPESMRKTIEKVSALPRANEVIDVLSTKWQGDYFYNEMATEQILKEQISEYSVIHLATHTSTGKEDPLKGKLLFYPGDTLFYDGFLHLYEILGWTLEADLLVLSGCKTGVGVLQEGDGLGSTARTFAQAGCSNTVMSLWSIKDYTSAEILSDFYRQVEANKAVDQSLRESKISFLKNCNDLYSHPYFWGGLIYNGDKELYLTDTLNPATRIYPQWLYYGSIILGLLCLLFIYMILSNKSST